MSCSLPLLLSSPVHTPIHIHHLHNPQILLSIFSSSSQSLSTFKSHIRCFSSSNTNPTFNPEESRWVREEQRWLREEQRWLREEQRWVRERESLLRRISELEMTIQVLERQSSVQEEAASVSETIASISVLLRVLKEKSLIAETASTSSPMLSEVKMEEEEVADEPELARVLEGAEKKVEKKKRKDLRMGSEGDEVRAMQTWKFRGSVEALQKLGFYSGEEDIEFSSFSSGTQRAVKTWQATLGAPEDGIMTEELLEKLYTDQQIEGAGSNINAEPNESLAITPKEGENGAVFASVTEMSKAQQKIVEEVVTEVEVCQQRVFLLGENRWEEPSRLAGRVKKDGESKTIATTSKCLTCRGEGRLMCTECDGTGEPNIEPQFLEWVDDGAKCPYCDGLGYTICDICEGKTVI